MAKIKWLALIFVLISPAYSAAEIISLSKTHFILRLEASSTLSPEALWERLIQPSAWWHPDHTYSGSSDNLALEAVAGGAYTIWTITISADGEGSKVVFDEVSNGPPSADMAEIAKAVDFVKGEAIGRLTETP